MYKYPSKQIIRICSILLSIFFISAYYLSPAYAFALTLGTRVDTDYNPFLLGPCTDNVSIVGKKDLEFRWLPQNGPGFFYFKVRLYKGYKTTDENLVLKQNLKLFTNKFYVPVDEFKNGEVYSWVLDVIEVGGRKSGRSYCSFTASDATGLPVVDAVPARGSMPRAGGVPKGRPLTIKND